MLLQKLFCHRHNRYQDLNSTSVMQVAWWEHLSKICSRIQGRGGQQHLVYKEFHTDFHFRIEASSVSKRQDLFTLLQCKTAQSPSRNVFSSALYTKKMSFLRTQWVFSGGYWSSYHEVQVQDFLLWVPLKQKQLLQWYGSRWSRQVFF